MELDLAGAAEILNVPARRVLQWIRKDSLPAEQVHGQYRLNPTHLLEWATLHGIGVRADRLPSSDAHSQSVIDALTAGGISYDLPGRDKDSVLRSVVKNLRLGNGVDREMVLQLFLAREAVGSTAIGDGIAIPHPRHPLILPVRQPLLSIFFLAEPIDFGPKVPEPVHTLLVLICPSIESHLRMIARVAGLLNDEAMRSLIKRRASLDEILTEIRQVKQRNRIQFGTRADENHRGQP